jgi:signal transduction histidine kinase
MQSFYRFCLDLRKISWWCRLLIVLGSFLLFEGLVVYMTTIGRDRGVASLLIITGILAALLFSWKKALAIEWGLLLVYLWINVSIKGWCYDQVVAFLSGTFLDFFIIATIGYFRHGFECLEQAIAKEQSLANVHHELRSPLTAIIGSLDIMRDHGRQISEQEHDMFLDYAVYASEELTRIADNVLDAIRADSDVSIPWIKQFDLCSVVSDILRRAHSDGHCIHIDIPEDIVVYGDSQHVGQVMRNLLSNCFKYSPDGSPVFVRVWQDDIYSYVCVRDKGPGIRAEHLPLIFQKFSRLDHDIAGPIRGIGLGLYICRRLIENMDGRIWVESAGISGDGSSFYFTLPRIQSKKICVPLSPVAEYRNI